MLGDGFTRYRVLVWNTAVEAQIEFFVTARSELRAKICVRDFYTPEFLANRILRVAVYDDRYQEAPSSPPDKWEPL